MTAPERGGDLWRRAQLGDRDAFGELFDRHANAIFAYCFRRTAEWEVAEDLTSVVFLEAWRKRDDVDLSDEAVLPWLFGVATNLLRNHRRARRRQDAALRRLARSRAEPDIADELAERLDAERRMRRILTHIRRLPLHEQDAIALCTWQELSTREAAIALGVPEATVRTRLFRARERLRRYESTASPSAEESTRERMDT